MSIFKKANEQIEKIVKEEVDDPREVIAEAEKAAREAAERGDSR